MSIYCSMPGIEGDDCPAVELEAETGHCIFFADDHPDPAKAGKIFSVKDEPCTGCDECQVGAPYVYDGSHIIVGPDSPRGGAVDWAVPASHIPTAGEPRDSEHEDRWPARHSYLRLSVDDQNGSATVVLDRRHVAHLVAQWSTWLEGPFIDDGFPPVPGTNAHALEELDHG